MSDREIEKTLQQNGLTAPRITPDDVEAEIVAEYYFTAAEGAAGREVAPLSSDHVHESLHLLTFCVLVLKNGFTVTGFSVPVSPADFVAQIGRDVAREDAKNKIWPMLAYALKDKLAAK